jgi:AbiV family abortive infection protein
MTPFKPDALKAMEACRSHAEEVFEGAKLLREKGMPHLAYHLATIALEELGKAQLIGMHSFAKDDTDSWYKKQTDDHVKKLFWALWGQFLSSKRPDQKDIDQIRGTATIIHETRLRGLYVEPTAENFIAPKDAVTDQHLDPLMTLVETKLALNPSLQGVEYQQEDLDLLNWFSNVTDDPEKRKFIFSTESFDKMATVTPKEWLTWIRDEIQNSEAKAMAVLQKEMERGFTPGEEGLEYKWEIKIRFYSQSHSIRPKPLNQWNDKVTWIKLFPVDKKKDRLDAIIKIPKFITIKGIYYVSFGFSNLLLTALNLASGGFFWWQEPKNLSTFFESLVDTEEKMTGKIGRSPELKLGWPQATLDEAILDRAIALFSAMPQPNEPPEASEALSHYMTGIALMAKTDVFLQFEFQSYGAFLSAVKSTLRMYREELGSEFPADVSTLLASLNVDDPFKQKHAGLIAGYEAHSLTQGQITLTEVAEMKRVAEGLLNHALITRLNNRAKREGHAEA